MSLDSSLSIAFSSLRVTESQLATSSENVTNASKEGYTTKTYDVNYTTYGSVTTPTGGITIGSIDYSLSKSAINDVSESGYYSVISDALDMVSTAIGSTDGDNTLSSSYSSLQSALETLATSPDDTSQKQNVVSAAQQVASNLNSLSESIQKERLNANQDIESSVETINSLLDSLKKLNDKIQSLTILGQSTANLEDERMVALESLSEQIGIDYFFNSNNAVQIYTENGTALLTTTVHELSYTATSYVTDETVYPGGFDAITVDGKDITGSISGGKLSGYIELRDETLVAAQDALDEVAQVMSDTVNSVLAEGTSYPAPSTLKGSVENSLADTFSATGTLRVAVVSDDGMVQGYSDIDLSTFTTISDVVSAIDSVSGVSAVIDGDGYLVISSDNSSYGVALNQMDSSVGTSSSSLSAYFGINALLVGDSASTIHVSDTLASDYSVLATGTLSDSSTLIVGDRAVSSADVEVINDLVNTLSESMSFSAAGNMGAQTTTMAGYISDYLSNIANLASEALDSADLARSIYEGTKEILENSTAVNVDEETIKITEYQNQYEAAAMIVSTIQELFSTLLEAVN